MLLYFVTEPREQAALHRKQLSLRPNMLVMDRRPSVHIGVSDRRHFPCNDPVGEGASVCP